MKSIADNLNKSDLDDISLINEQINESHNSNQSPITTTTAAKSSKYLTIQPTVAQQHHNSSHHQFFLHHHGGGGHNNETTPDLFLQYVREGNLALVKECLKNSKK